MNKYFYYAIVVLSITFIYFFNLNNKYKNFSEITILSDGRLKTLESFAKSNLNNLFYTKKNNLYSHYLAEIIFSFNSFSNEKTIKIKNDNLLINIDVKISKNNLYSINDILAGIFKNIDIINNFSKLDISLLNSTQIELINIYNKINFILNLRESFKNIEVLTIYNKYIKKNINNIEYFYIIKSKKNWINLNEALNIKENYIKPELKFIMLMNKFYNASDYKIWNKICFEYKKNTYKNLTTYENIKIKIEMLYNKINFLFYSIVFYLIGFIISLIATLKEKYKNLIYIVKKIAYTALTLNALDIFFRLIIAERPPVTNLYESIIFVNFISSFLFLFTFKKFKNPFNFTIIMLGLFVLQLIGYNYNYDAEIKNLMSVLNTNFWLTLHVLTITTGYSFCIITSMLGHIYFFYLLKNNKEQLLKIFSYMIFFLIMSLFFTLNGTILGGVWADQSWGRFWGWDPKENGALLVVLWLILILHIKIFNKSKILLTIPIIFLNIILSISWFGVNILNVGLHSYGFTKSVSLWLMLFIIFELSYIISILSFYKKKT